MKNILCFGDSNTYGYAPETGERYDRDTRWTALLQKALGDGYYVIEEGLNGRTCAFDDPLDFDDTKNGRRALCGILNSHIPLDLVLIMLGTNDTKIRFGSTPYDIAKAAGRLAEYTIKITAEKNFNLKPARVLIVSPILIGEGMRDTSPFRFEFGPHAIDIARDFAPFMKQFADESGSSFFDATSVATPTPLDSLHLDRDGHRALAEALTAKVRELIG